MSARIQNKHLVQRLARPQRAPELRLLGEGDDAIIGDDEPDLRSAAMDAGGGLRRRDRHS